MYSDYFLEICDYIIIRFARFFLKVTFDSFSSSAPSIMMPGRHGREAGGPLACVFNHNPPWLLIHILSGTEQLVPAPRARETCGIAPSLLFKMNFAVDQALKAGTWRRHNTFTRHYLRVLAHWSLETFHLGPVVVAQALV